MRVVEPWNSIPDQIVGAPSLKSFKRRLDKFWAGQDIRFNYEETPNTSSRRELSRNVVSEDESDSDLNIEV